MKELPYFRFTSQEWQNGMITLESMEDQGVFINACSYYWLSNCSITIAVLKQRLKGYEKSIDTLIEKEIIYDNGGNITIGFLDEQWGDLKEYREKKQIAGRKGGLKKSSNAKAQLKHNSSYKDKDKDKDKDNIITPKKKKHHFKDSPYFDKSTFHKYFGKWLPEKKLFYYNAAIEYSGANGGRYLDWGLAIKSWDRRAPYEARKDPKTFSERDGENLTNYMNEIQESYERRSGTSGLIQS